MNKMNFLKNLLLAVAIADLLSVTFGVSLQGMSWPIMFRAALKRQTSPGASTLAPKSENGILNHAVQILASRVFGPLRLDHFTLLRARIWTNSAICSGVRPRVAAL